MEAKIVDMAESGTSAAGEAGIRPGGSEGWSGRPDAPHGGGRGWSGRPDAPHGGRGWSGRPHAPHGGGRGWSGRPDAPHGGGREIFGRVSPGVHDCALGAWEWSNKQRVDSSGGSSEYRCEDRKWTTAAILGRDLVWRPSDKGRVMDSGTEGSVVEMEEFPAVYVRTLFTGKQMREEEDDLCTYGLFDEVVGEATDSSTNAAVISGLSDENLYRGEKGFTEFGASCDTLSCMLKRLLVRYEQCDGIVDGKDVVGTIESRLHANVGTHVVDEKQRPSEITEPGELSSSDSGCDSGNSCDCSFNDDGHNCVEDTCKGDARRLDAGCGARELCMSEEDDQRLNGGCCARSTCMGEVDDDGQGSRCLDGSKMDEFWGCEAGLESEGESEYEDDEQYLQLEETILQQEEIIEVLGRDLKKFEDGKKQFKERVEVWEKQANREKDALRWNYVRGMRRNGLSGKRRSRRWKLRSHSMSTRARC